MQHAASPIRSFRFGLFEADVSHKTLTRNGVRVKLQDQPFRVLLLLLDRPGETVTRDQLRSSLWPDGTFVDFDGSLNVILKKLRAALDDNPDNPRFIETVPRSGYRFIAPVSVLREEPEAPTPQRIALPVEPAVPERPLAIPVTPANRHHIRAALIYSSALLVLIAGSIVVWKRITRPKQSASAFSASPAAPVHLRRSVAVLGFQNLSASPTETWLGTALSEMLSTELASGDKLRLISDEDVANLHAYSPWAKVETLDAATTARIGTALGSDLIVLGSYATIGKPEHGQLRIDVRLQNCQTGEVLTEIAEIGATEDLFGIVSRIGGRLRNRIGIPQAPEADEMLAQASLPANPEAARFYSLGLEKLRAFDLQLARELFEQAIAAEPRFPLAHAMLSRTDLFLGHFDHAKAEAKRGLDLAAGLPRVQRMQIEASYDQAIGERGKAADIYRVLFNLFPDSLDYGLQLSKLQQESYRPEEAMETVRQLRRLPAPLRDDPLIDLREGFLLTSKDHAATERLYRSAAQKALAQDRRQVYARAEQSLCYLNPQHSPNPPECREAYDIFTAAGNLSSAGGTLQIMAEHQRLTGHPLEAVPLYEQSIRTVQEAGDYEAVGVALNNLSLIYETQGQFARAEDAYRKARDNFASVNDRINLAITIANIGDIESWRGNFQSADQLYRQSWEMADAAKPALDQYPHIGHSNLLLMRGQLDDAAAEIMPQIASLSAGDIDPWQRANALTALGDIERQRGDLDSAQKTYEQAFQLLNKINAPTDNQEIALAQVAIERGHAGQAESQLHSVIASLEKNRNAGDEFSAYIMLGKALLAQSKVPDARATLQRARSLIDVHQFPVYSMPLETLELRARAADAPAGKAGRDTLLVAQRGLTAIVQRAHQIGFYTAECEARIALLEIESKLPSTSVSSHLATVATEAQKRGFLLYASKAAKINSHPDILALNKPAP